MADEGFDPCECIYTHELAMRRLVSLLRQSQSYCTDTECVDELPGPQSGSGDGSDNMAFFVMVWTLLAMLLFFLRPASLRSNPDAKPANSQHGGGSPPAPPTAN